MWWLDKHRNKMTHRFLGAMSIVMLFVFLFLLKVWLFSTEIPTQNDTETKDEQNTINPSIQIHEIKGMEAKQTVLLLKPANVEEFERPEQPEPNQRSPSPSSPLSVHGIDFDEFVANWMRDNLVSPFDLEYDDQNVDIQSVPECESNSQDSAGEPLELSTISLSESSTSSSSDSSYEKV